MGFAVVVVFKLHGHEASRSAVTDGTRLFRRTSSAFGGRRHDDFSAISPHVFNAQRIHILGHDQDAPEPERGAHHAQSYTAVAARRFNNNTPLGQFAALHGGRHHLQSSAVL